MATGSPNEAKEWFAEYQSLAEAQKNSMDWFYATRGLGNAARALLAYDDAQAYYEKAIELARKLQDKIEISLSLGQKGALELFLGHFRSAIDTLSQAAAIAEDIYGDRNFYFANVSMLCVAYWLSGDFKQAKSTFVKARRFITDDLYTQASSIIFPAELQAMTGQYHQAHQQINSLDDLIQDEFVSAELDGHRNRVQGWLALVNEAYAEAYQHFDLSIQHSKKTAGSVEWVAWAQAGSAAAFMFQNQWENAYQTLRQSLEASIEIKGFIPLLFTLPFACYYLAQEHPDLAGEVYAQIQTSPFLANAQFFKDTVYRHLPDEIKQSKRVDGTNLPEPELIQNLWETASKIMALWETEC